MTVGGRNSSLPRVKMASVTAFGMAGKGFLESNRLPFKF